MATTHLADDICEIPGRVPGYVGRGLAFQIDTQFIGNRHGKVVYLVRQGINELCSAAGRTDEYDSAACLRI